MTDQPERAEEIVRKLAAMNSNDVGVADGWQQDYWCLFCHQKEVFSKKDPEAHHLASCLWRQAREWVAAHPLSNYQQTVVLHGRACPHWDESHLASSESILSHKLDWVEEDNWWFGVCPDCLQTVYTYADFGEIAFGV